MEGALRRKAANEAVFREVNERIEGLQTRFAISDAEPLSLVCECDQLQCTEPIQIAVDGYERIRAHPDRFLVLPGHEDPTVEDIVDTGPGYLVVRKHAGEARRFATDTDPRS